MLLQMLLSYISLFSLSLLPKTASYLNSFLEITKIDIVIDATDSFITYDEATYNKYGDSEWGWNTDAATGGAELVGSFESVEGETSC